MTLLAFAMILNIGKAEISATKYELFERQKKLDVAWLASTDTERKKAASAALAKGAPAFFTQNWSGACQSVDAAIAALEGRSLLTEDAIDVRFVPSYVEPGAFAKLRISWAYLPAGKGPVTVKVAGRQISVEPGETVEVDADLGLQFPDYGRESEVALLVPISVGSLTSSAYISKVRGFPERVKALLDSPIALVKALAQPLQLAIEGRPEQDSPVLDTLITAEELVAGEISPLEVRKWTVARRGDSTFSVAVPANADALPTVVVAIPDQFEQESAFFETYGRGKIAVSCLQRGWIFVSVKPGEKAVEDSLIWIKENLDVTPEQIILIGHGYGGVLAMEAAKKRPVSAIGLMAPTAKSLPGELRSTPMFSVVGGDEPIELRSNNISLGREILGRKGNLFKMFPNCEHRMIVAEAADSLLEYLDSVLKQSR